MAEEIRQNLFRIEIPLPNNPLRYLNSYVIKSKDRNLIIDTGFNRKECIDAMNAGLSEIDIDLNKTDIFITHLHADHFGLASTLATENSKVFFNRPDIEIIEAGGGWEPMLAHARENGFPENMLDWALKAHPGHKYGSGWLPEITVLNNGDKIEVGEYTFECVITPGHTMGHTCLYEADKKIFISGDHILIDITPNIQSWADEQNLLQYYIDSLKKVSKLEVEIVLPGHRRLFSHFKERIEELIQHHKNRAEEIIMILDQNGPMNGFQIASRMTWDIDCKSWEEFPVSQKWFATGEAIAHLIYLENKGSISREKKAEITTFSLAG